ncbi:hypothetical protein HZA73_04515 [candidate division TA06 bacterium]|nr:hypothetical protein [candidate division TA06 bacterium]
MPKFIYENIRIIITIVVSVIIALGCSSTKQSGVTVGLCNNDTVSIDSVTVYVSGQSYFVGNINKSQTKEVIVNPKFDSHIEIGLKKDGKSKQLIVDCYLEHNYSGKIAVSFNRDTILSVLDSIKL